MNRIEKLEEALKLALEYWAHRQQRYKNRHPQWVQKARAALAERQPEAAPEGWRPNWKWDHSVAGQPEKTWHYDRGELLLGLISLGQYSRWSNISLERDGIDPKKPIHAWLSHASFVGGVYQHAPSAWFATAEEAKTFVEEGSLKTLSDAGMLLFSPRELLFPSAPTPASAVASEAAPPEFDVHAYVQDYEFAGDGGDYRPNEKERALIEDAIHGALFEIGNRTASKSSRDAGLEEAAKICDALYGRHNEWATTTSKTVKTKADRAEMKGRADAAQFLAHRIRALASTPAPASAQRNGGEE